MSDKIYVATELPADELDACEMVELLCLDDQEEKLEPTVSSMLRRHVKLTYSRLVGEIPIIDDVILALERCLPEDRIVCKPLAESLKRNTTHKRSLSRK